ncbi:hypothetical protein BGZ57DRAFT_902929 [Hyaloscypha finlandica]|nr:hypothetical protein BGZ57DRAFT_902929 [Hyaloscypha finlandica]
MRLQNHSEDDGNGSGDGDNGNLTYRGGKSVDKEGSVVTVPEAEAAHQEELEEEKENERIENVRQARLVREQAAREEEKRQREAVRQAKALAPSGADEQEPVRFKDAVGRKFSFPFELCATWAGIEELIRQAFLHVEGLGPHVAEGHYDLIGPNGEIILPRVWETIIEPGWSISMYMWPIPEPPKPGQFPPGPPPPPSAGASGAPVIVNLTQGPLGSRPRSRRNEPTKGVLNWIAGSSTESKPSGKRS